MVASCEVPVQWSENTLEPNLNTQQNEAAHSQTVVWYSGVRREATILNKYQ